MNVHKIHFCHPLGYGFRNSLSFSGVLKRTRTLCIFSNTQLMRMEMLTQPGIYC